MFGSSRAKQAGLNDAEPLPLAVLEFQSPTAAMLATQVPLFARHSNVIITAMVILL